MFFSQLKKVRKNGKKSLQTKVRILEATVMTVVKYGSEAWALRKTDENLLDVFQGNCPRIFLVPGRLTIFQTVGCTKNVVQSRFLGL